MNLFLLLLEQCRLEYSNVRSFVSWESWDQAELYPVHGQTHPGGCLDNLNRDQAFNKIINPIPAGVLDPRPSKSYV